MNEELQNQKRISDIEYRLNNHRHLEYDGTKVLANRIYAGFMDATADGSQILPNGWTGTQTATGAYTITHNLNFDSYSVFLTPISSTNITMSSLTKSATTFTVRAVQSDNPAIDINTDFYFFLVRL